MKKTTFPSSIRPSNFEKQADEISEYSQFLNHLDRLRLMKILITNSYGLNACESKN